MYRAGGNAVDAAVAAAFASFVSETFVVNIGAGGFATVADKQGQACSYDFSCTMPRLRPAHERDFHEVVIGFGNETQAFMIGRASTAVPGAVAGLCRLAQERGSLPLARLLAPAITLAEKGLPLNSAMAGLLELLIKINTDTVEVANLFAPQGRLLREGDHYSLPSLARTLQRLADEGPDYFYRGDLAAAIVADHRQHGGLITAADLAAYTVPRNQPLQVPYRDVTVLLPPPSSLGGPLIAFALRLLDSVSLNGLEFQGPDHLKDPGPRHAPGQSGSRRMESRARGRPRPTCRLPGRGTHRALSRLTARGIEGRIPPRRSGPGATAGQHLPHQRRR